MTTSLRILLALDTVKLTAKLDEHQQLQLDHRGEALSQHDYGVEIFLGSAEPVTVEIDDFEDAAGRRWTVAATGNAVDRDGAWTRGDGICRSVWSETTAEVPVNVTATNGTSTPVARPIFIKVQPVGVKPWP